MASSMPEYLTVHFYPFGNVKTELIQGLKHGFKLQYNGPRLPVQSNNFTFVEVPARSKSTLGVAFLALRGFTPFEVCKKGLVIAL
jgi:hypothetical protein